MNSWTAIICRHFRGRGRRNCQRGHREHSHLLPCRDEAGLLFTVSLVLCSLHCTSDKGWPLLPPLLPRSRRWKASLCHGLSRKLLLGSSPCLKNRLSCLLCWALQCLTESALQSQPTVQHQLSLPLAALQLSGEAALQGGPESTWLCCPPAPTTASTRGNDTSVCIMRLNREMSVQ